MSVPGKLSESAESDGVLQAQFLGEAVDTVPTPPLPCELAVSPASAEKAPELCIRRSRRIAYHMLNVADGDRFFEPLVELLRVTVFPLPR